LSISQLLDSKRLIRANSSIK